jgi:hypothetical protein
MCDDNTFAVRRAAVAASERLDLPMPDMLARWHEMNADRPGETDEEVTHCVDVEIAIENAMIERSAEDIPAILAKAKLMIALICSEDLGRQVDAYPENAPAELPLPRSHLMAASLVADMEAYFGPAAALPIGTADVTSGRGGTPCLLFPGAPRLGRQWTIGIWSGSDWCDLMGALCQPQYWAPLPATPA